MRGVNRAIKNWYLIENSARLSKGISGVPCIFISYQRADADYAKEVADYIKSHSIDVYLDIEDEELKYQMQENDPGKVTSLIKKGLNQSTHMIAIISPSTYKSPWVPFEIGYAYDNKDDNLKVLKHRGIDKNSLPSYLKIKELLHGKTSLNNFLTQIKSNNPIYRNVVFENKEKVHSYNSYIDSPINRYLDNE